MSLLQAPKQYVSLELNERHECKKVLTFPRKIQTFIFSVHQRQKKPSFQV